MTVLPLLAVGILLNLLAVLFVLVSIVLILVILIQKGRGGGLSGAFGGGMASGLLGSKTGDFLTWATITVVGIYLVLAVVLARFYKPRISDFGTARPAPAASQETAPVEQPTRTNAGTTTRETAPSAEQPAGTDTGEAPGGSVPAAEPSGGTDRGPGAGPTTEPNAAGG